MLSGSSYAHMNFEQWPMNNNGAYAAASVFGVYGPTPYDFTRTPTTSGSDESMNDSRIDPKQSPKYREKRNKNNEAAKKSRAQRKQRELDNMKENETLKNRIACLEREAMTMVADMQKMQKTIRDMTMQQEVLKRRLEVHEGGKFNVPLQQENKFPLSDVNGQFPRIYESLN